MHSKRFRKDKKKDDKFMLQCVYEKSGGEM